jgi:hypothetical protein
VAIASNKPNSYSRSQLQAYGWRSFCVEFLCGTVAVMWYLLSLAERTALKGLTQLEKLAISPSDDLPEYGGAQNILFQEEQSSFGSLAEGSPHSRR